MDPGLSSFRFLHGNVGMAHPGYPWLKYGSRKVPVWVCKFRPCERKGRSHNPGRQQFIFQFSIRRGNTTPENAACVGVVCLNDPFYLGKVESGPFRVGKDWRNPARTKGGWRSRRTMDE